MKIIWKDLKEKKKLWLSGLDTQKTGVDPASNFHICNYTGCENKSEARKQGLKNYKDLCL